MDNLVADTEADTAAALLVEGIDLGIQEQEVLHIETESTRPVHPAADQEMIQKETYSYPLLKSLLYSKNQHLLYL